MGFGGFRFGAFGDFIWEVPAQGNMPGLEGYKRRSVFYNILGYTCSFDMKFHFRYPMVHVSST